MTRTVTLDLKAEAFGSVATVKVTRWFRQPVSRTYDCVRGPSAYSEAIWADRDTGILAGDAVQMLINQAAQKQRDTE